MKIVFVRCENDYDAIRFEQAYGTSPSLETWNAINNGELLYDDDGEELAGVEALQFGDVDKKFIDFIQKELLDYDYIKDQNFFIVQE